MTPVAKAVPLLTLLFGLSTHHKKRYCFPTQKKIIELLLKRLKLKMSIATLNRWLRVVEDEKYVRRVRRIRRDEKLGMVFQSTLYVITYRGYVLLNSVGVRCWDKMREMVAAAKRKLSPAAKKDEKEVPAGEGGSFTEFRERHPEARLPWNGSGDPGKK